MSPGEVRCGTQQQHTVGPTCRCRTCLNTFAVHDSEEDSATTIPSVVSSSGLELILSSEPFSGTQHTHDRSPMDTSSDFSMEEPAAEKSIAFTPLDTAPSTFPIGSAPSLQPADIANASEPTWAAQ